MISLKKPESKKKLPRNQRSQREEGLVGLATKLPSAIIDSRGYVLRKKIVSKELDKLIQDELIVKPELNNEFGQSDYFKVYTEDDENFYLPKFWAQENIGVEAQINLVHKKKYIAEIKFKGYLRSSQSSPQIEVIESMLDIFYDPITNRLKPWASSIISIRTGGGKTVLGLFWACFIGYRTVIFCHNSSLFDQWIERIEEYVDGARIGWIRGDKVKISGCNIVIAMIQTVMTGKKDYGKILSGFNFAIYDECHHLGAKVFSSVMRQFQPAYSLGLSATVDRDDKLDKVFKWYLGPVGYMMEGSLDYDVGIQVYKFGIHDSPKFKPLINRFTKKPNITPMSVNLTQIDQRNAMIVQVIQKTFEQGPNRQMVLISHFVDHLEKLFELLNPLFPGQIGLYTGPILKKLKPEQKTELEQKKIILATYKIMCEGIDIKTLDTIFIVTPMKKVLQSCGRILRRKKHEYEHIPLMMEIYDQLAVYNGMHRSRMGQYKAKYLKPEGSWLEYYTCDSQTNHEIKFESKPDLSYLRKEGASNDQDSELKKTKQKISSTDLAAMFDSDSD